MHNAISRAELELALRRRLARSYCLWAANPLILFAHLPVPFSVN